MPVADLPADVVAVIDDHIVRDEVSVADDGRR